MQSFDLECKVIRGSWSIGEIEYCEAQNLYITSENAEITSVNGSTEPTSLPGLFIDHQTAHYLPKGIGRFFPNLNGLAVWSSKLKSLTQDDLKPLKQLLSVTFNDNDVTDLEDGLFEYNSKLQIVSFNDNKLKLVGENVLSILKNLNQLHFQNNVCINDDAWSSAVPALVEKIKSQCRKSQNKISVNSKMHVLMKAHRGS